MTTKVKIIIAVIIIIFLCFVAADAIKRQQYRAEVEAGEHHFSGYFSSRGADKPFICVVPMEGDYFRCDLPRYAIDLIFSYGLFIFPLIPIIVAGIFFLIIHFIVKLIYSTKNAHSKHSNS